MGVLDWPQGTHERGVAITQRKGKKIALRIDTHQRQTHNSMILYMRGTKIQVMHHIMKDQFYQELQEILDTGKILRIPRTGRNSRRWHVLKKKTKYKPSGKKTSRSESAKTLRS